MNSKLILIFTSCFKIYSVFFLSISFNWHHPSWKASHLALICNFISNIYSFSPMIVLHISASTYLLHLMRHYLVSAVLVYDPCVDFWLGPPYRAGAAWGVGMGGDRTWSRWNVSPERSLRGSVNLYWAET